jgi:hypothetical protein
MAFLALTIGPVGRSTEMQLAAISSNETRAATTIYNGIERYFEPEHYSAPATGWPHQAVQLQLRRCRPLMIAFTKSGASSVSRSTRPTGLVDLFGVGNLANERVLAAFQHVALAERPSDRLDHGVAMWRWTGVVVALVPSGARTSLRLPRN